MGVGRDFLGVDAGGVLFMTDLERRVAAIEWVLLQIEADLKMFKADMEYPEEYEAEVPLEKEEGEDG